LHFPDPVHKARQEKLRVLDTEFLDAIAYGLVEGGELSVVSDKQDFFLEMLELVEQDHRFEKQHIARYLDGFEPLIKSRFQLAWERKGISPKRFVVSKKAL
jgi:tRNA G46 methylase TrmB